MTLTEEISPQLMRRIALGSESLNTSSAVLQPYEGPLEEGQSAGYYRCCAVIDMSSVYESCNPEVEANRSFLSRVYPIHQQPVNRLRWKGLSAAERTEKELAKTEVAEGEWGGGRSLVDVISD